MFICEHVEAFLIQKLPSYVTPLSDKATLINKNK